MISETISLSKQRINPILPIKLTLKTRSDYEKFIKKGLKIAPKVEIEKIDGRSGFFRNQVAEITGRLLKTIKTIKYARKLDLNQLVLYSSQYYLPKMQYFAKRMANSKVVFIYDSKAPEQKYQGIFETWARYVKKAESFHYFHAVRQTFFGVRNQPTGPIKLNQEFIRLLRYQPRLRDLQLRLSNGSRPFIKEYFNFKKYPSALEKLSLIDLSFDQSINFPLSHLVNLKHLELTFNYVAKADFISCILQSLPSLSSHLQSLALHWPDGETNSIIPAFSGFKTLRQLTKLKIGLPLRSSNNERENIFDAFSECPLNHLELRVDLDSEEQLIPVANFIQKFPHLEHLDLQILSVTPFKNFDNAKEVLKQIDNLPLLKRLSLSIAPRPVKNQSFPEVNPLFTKLFTKSIPLESFKINLRPMTISNQGFLQLLESLQPLTSNLRNLEVNVGEYRPDKSEFETVLNFVKSLKNIRSLKLGSLSIPLRNFFNELADVIFEMPSLKILALGEVKGTVTKPACVKIVERIIQKRGLEEFDCNVSDTFRASLHKKPKASPKINLLEIEKVNPFLKRPPSLPIFNFVSSQMRYW